MTRSLFLLGCLLCLGAAPAIRPRFPLSKETTRILGPIDAWGYVDYAAALNEANAKRIKPRDNAAVLLWKALGPAPEGRLMPHSHFKPLGMERPPEKGDYFINLDRFGTNKLKLKEDEFEKLWDEQRIASQSAWKAKDLPRIAAWLEANSNPLAVAIEASKRKRCYIALAFGDNPTRSDLIGALLPSVQAVRGVASALASRALMRACEGKLDDAWADLVACHRLGRLVAQGNTLIEALVGFAVESIAQGATVAFIEAAKPDTKRIAAMLADLEAMPAPADMADKIENGERMMFLDSTQAMDAEGLRYLEGLSGGTGGSAQSWRGQVDFTEARRTGNSWYDRMAQAMRKATRAERLRAFHALEMESRQRKAKASDWTAKVGMLMGEPKQRGRIIGDILLSLFTPALEKVQDAADRLEQQRANLRLALRLERHHREKGSYPETLEGFKATDLFSGKELLYRREEGGYVLWSVGPKGDTEPPANGPVIRMKGK